MPRGAKNTFRTPRVQSHAHPNGSRLTCAAKRMLNCKQPTPITDPVTTPVPQTRRQVQPLVRAPHSRGTILPF